MSEKKIGFRNGVRAAITWLHRRAVEMNDPHAKALLNSAAFDLGHALKDGQIDDRPRCDRCGADGGWATCPHSECPQRLSEVRQP